MQPIYTIIYIVGIFTWYKLSTTCNISVVSSTHVDLCMYVDLFTKLYRYQSSTSYYNCWRYTTTTAKHSKSVGINGVRLTVEFSVFCTA